MIQKLSHATIYVLDQDQALDFYTNKLGFEVRLDMTIESGFRWLTVRPKSQPDLELVLFAVKPGSLDEAAAGHLRALLEHGALGSAYLTPTIATRHMPSFQPKESISSRRPRNSLMALRRPFVATRAICLA